MIKNLKEVTRLLHLVEIGNRQSFEDDRVEVIISDGVKVQIIKNTIQGHLKKEVKK